MKLIEVKSRAQREMLERCAVDPKEASRRGMTCEQAIKSLDAAPKGRLPERLGPNRENRHRVR